jgi:hypothetical protein
MGYIEDSPESSDAGVAGGKRKRPGSGAGGATAAAVAFVVEAEASIADLEEQRPKGMGPLERALAARLRSAIAQLRECASQVGEDGLMVAGSMQQQRAHPLLKVIADLRREIADGLKDLTFRAGQTEMLEAMNSLSKRARTTMTTEELVALATGATLSADLHGRAETAPAPGTGNPTPRAAAGVSSSPATRPASRPRSVPQA